MRVRSRLSYHVAWFLFFRRFVSHLNVGLPSRCRLFHVRAVTEVSASRAARVVTRSVSAGPADYVPKSLMTWGTKVSGSRRVKVVDTLGFYILSYK